MLTTRGLRLPNANSNERWHMVSLHFVLTGSPLDSWRNSICPENHATGRIQMNSPATTTRHIYEIRPRKDRRGFDLISDRLPLGLLWFEGPDAIVDAVNYAKFCSRSHPAIIRVFDEFGAVVGTDESAGDFRQW